MASESVFSSSKEAILSAVKKLQETPAYQDRWIADVDIAAAIRHEYELWDPKFDSIVTYKAVTSAVNSDKRLKLALDDANESKSNSTGMFRRTYTPSTVTTVKVTDVDAYTIEKKTKKPTRELKWYYFDSNTKPLVRREVGMAGSWYDQSYDAVEFHVPRFLLVGRCRLQREDSCLLFGLRESSQRIPEQHVVRLRKSDLAETGRETEESLSFCFAFL